jgi:drug/metabolite transporter (DMT)-like permease
VAEVGGNQAGLFMHLMPVFAIVLSALFLAEYPQPYHWLGIALILGGIVMTTRRPGARP